MRIWQALSIGLGVVQRGLIFKGREELFDDGPAVFLVVFKSPIVKALPSRVIGGALVKARGLPDFP